MKEKCLKVPYLDQSRTAPTGCESVSAVMLLRFLGYSTEIREFIDLYLDKGAFHTEEGEPVTCAVFECDSAQEGLLPDSRKIIGPDPWQYFAGDPYDKDAFGCYAPVIAAALNKVFRKDPGFANDKDNTNHSGSNDVNDVNDVNDSGTGSGNGDHSGSETGYGKVGGKDCRKEGWEAVTVMGQPLQELAEENIIGKGLPVLVWCTIDQDNAVTGPGWYLEDGSLFTWYSREHCVLLTGIGEKGYVLHDPWNNNGIVTVDRKLFEKGYRQQHAQAVVLRKKRSESALTK